ncbi:hypothetical protein [Xanthomonas fragariae]|uniref:hypothetical protein n=1 Tax=Xanthomonas fragariae TaxID=48664 RepID=UPI0022AA880D|nr:hypothetical protein [Xanthomonas fragariae]WAT14337.1 hypothetical protein OZ429_15045 [Xanthomonas fragariae]
MRPVDEGISSAQKLRQTGKPACLEREIIVRNQSTVNNMSIVEHAMQRDLPGPANTSGVLPFFSL